MVQVGSKLNVIDNSGIKEVGCIKVLGVGLRRYGKVGDIVIVSSKKGRFVGGFRKEKVFKGVVVRVKAPVKRLGGEVIRFNDNAIVLIKPDKSPISSRVTGAIMVELRQKRFMKVVSLALICL